MDKRGEREQQCGTSSKENDSNMANDAPSRAKTQDPAGAQGSLTPERIARWVKGEITLAELNQVSGPEMLEMAIYGFTMYENGRYEDARTIFEALCALDPRESYYRTALGAVLLAMEDLEQADKLFTEAIQLNVKEIASYVNRGEVYLRQGKIREAAQDFKKAVEMDPEGRDPLTRRARLLAAAALQTLEVQQEQARNKQSQPKAAPSAGKPAPAAKPGASPAKPVSTPSSPKVIPASAAGTAKPAASGTGKVIPASQAKKK